MAAEPTALDIEVEKAPPGTKPFIPAADGKQVEFKLEPLAPTEEAFKPYVPAPSRWKPPPLVASARRGLIVDIETTGLMPWDSRFMLIGAKDLSNPLSKGVIFYDEDEERLLRAFVDAFKEGGYDEIVAYNLPFDMRYIFAKGMRYGIPMKALIDAEWTDLAWRMQQVKFHRSALRQKPGTLNQWSEFLFGETKLLSYKELLAAWGEGNIELIMQYNLKDLDLTAKLWMLSEFVLTGDPWTPPDGIDAINTYEEPKENTSKGLQAEKEAPKGSPSPVEGFRRVVSVNSQAEQWIPADATSFTDFVTGQVERV